MTAASGMGERMCSQYMWLHTCVYCMLQQCYDFRIVSYHMRFVSDVVNLLHRDQIETEITRRRRVVRRRADEMRSKRETQRERKKS